MSPRKELGLRIAIARTKLGMTQEEMAFRAGMHLTAVNKIECGRGYPQIESLLKIAAALGCDPGELLAGLAWQPDGSADRHVGARS